MPQIAVTLLSEQPELLGRLCEVVLGRSFPSGLALEDSTLRLGDPMEVRPDVVLGSQAGWVLAEVQGQVDDEKAWRWPLAMALKANQTRRAGDLVVLTFSRAVAEWAAHVARHRSPLGTRSHLEPVVILLAGDAVEKLLDEAHPELAFFAAWAVQERHGQARAIVNRALDLSQRLPPDLQAPMRRAIYNMLSEPMLSFLREVAMNPDRIPEGPAMRLFRLEAFSEGKAEGEARGRAEDVLAVLEARGMDVSDSVRERIRAMSNVEELSQLLRVAVESAEALFA